MNIIQPLSVLTASLLVCPVVAVLHPVAHLVLGDAGLTHAAVEVVLRAIGAVQLVGEVRAVHDAVANAIAAARVAQFGHAAWEIRARYTVRNH